MNWLLPKSIFSSTQTYHMHDNGSRPFKVIIKGNQVEVFKESDDNVSRDRVYETFPRYIFRVNDVFVGNSPQNKWTKFSGGFGPAFNGNSLLLHLGFRVYVFIGWEICSFRALYPIVEFVSIVGNNDVCYPYAVDDHHNYYLLTENVVLKYHDKLLQQMSTYDNPYEYYYHYNLITSDLGISPSRLPIIPNFSGISEFYIGTDQYMLRYTTKPNKEYNRLVSQFDPYIWYKGTDGVSHTITKEDYIILMKDFGTYNHFEPLKEKCQYYTRM